MNIDMTKQYEPKFYTTDRDGKIALWVVLPNGTKQNIWDVEKKCWTEDVQEAVMHAYLIGMNATAQIVTTCCRFSYTSTNRKFEHIK
jgi:S-methylmethionine-dependent homocysteine/selenocysteine methylase